MGEHDPKPRQCPMCGHIFKTEEKRCIVCFPVSPNRKQPGKQQNSPKTEPWYCADCKHKFSPEFQECPVCRTKTHVFCQDCSTLHLKKEPCPVCDDESTEMEEPEELTESLEEADEAIEKSLEQDEKEELMHEEGFREEIREKMVISKEDAAKLKAEEQQIERKTDGRKQPWTEERKQRQAELRQQGKIGRPSKKIKQTQTEAKQEALKKTQAAKKKGDGRKNNRPSNRPAEKQQKPEEKPKEAPPLPIEPTPEKQFQAILKLDIDGKNGLNQLCDRLWIIKYLGLKVEAVEIYHTTNGFHAVLKCDNIFKSWEILLFQTWLGSDFRREMCNLLKIERGSENWNVLFKEKWKYNPLGQEIRVSQETFDEELSQKVLRLIQLGD